MAHEQGSESDTSEAAAQEHEEEEEEHRNLRVRDRLEKIWRIGSLFECERDARAQPHALLDPFSPSTRSKTKTEHTKDLDTFMCPVANIFEEPAA